MSNASRDENRVPTLLGVSSVDLVTPVPVAVDPTTNRMLVELTVSTGTGAPGSTPSVVGAMYVDTSGKKVYVATGTTNSGDWAILN